MKNIKSIDRIGQKYNRWTILSVLPNPNPNRNGFLFLCQCDCGNIKKLRTDMVVGGGVKSCGCYQREKLRISRRSHIPDVNLTTKQISIINGHLLGDGTLERRSSNWNASLKIQRARTDKEYLQWSAGALSDIVTPSGITDGESYDIRTNKTYYYSNFRTHTYPFLTQLYDKWYINGIKCVPADFKLDILSFQVWFADDGFVNPPKDKLNRRQFDLKLATNGFDLVSVKILQNCIKDLFGIIAPIYIDDGNPIIRIFKTEDTNKILKEIDQDFPLDRKSSVWRSDKYNLFNPVVNTPSCPRCGYLKAYRNGWANGTQNYKCLNCNRSFKKIYAKRRLRK